MAKKPKDAGHPGQPRGTDFQVAARSEGIDRLARPADAPDRGQGHGGAAQPLGTAARSRGEVDALVHPSGGRRLLEGAERGVRPVVAGMLLRGH
jgi:hypothetical protein